MSKCVVTTGVLDSDPKGKNGRGTIFWMTIEHDEGIERFEYGLLELLSKQFDREAIIKPYREKADAARKAAELQAQQEKKKALEDRKASVKEDPALMALIEEVVAANPGTIEDYKKGKQQALNFMVGLTIKHIKARNIPYADGAFGITELLKKRIA